MPLSRGGLWLALALAPGAVSRCQTDADSVSGLLETARQAKAVRRYEAAVEALQAAIRLAPGRAGLHKELGYTYARMGETEAAREAFGEAWRLAPGDHHAGLEYAFLCNETRRQAEARRLFNQIRKTADGEAKATAERAFANIEAALAGNIARWQSALAANARDFSAHLELARLYEQRDQAGEAAAHYEAAWRIAPEKRALLIDLGRMWKAAGREAAAATAWLAASRARDPRTAETARGLIGQRYPYVYEFEEAIAFDPGNIPLRRELAFLLLAIGRQAEAEAAFAKILEIDPRDVMSAAQLGLLRLARNERDAALPLLERVLKGDDEELAGKVRRALEPHERTLMRRPAREAPAPGADPKSLGSRAYAAGQLREALRHYQAALEANPADHDVALKLGYTYNMLRQDEEAIRYFEMARASGDPAVRREASRAYRNLRPQFALLRTTSWLFPLYSTRWDTLFGYGQWKLELRLGRLPLRPYLTTRFVGDTRGAIGQVSPQYLSESSFLVGVGLATPVWHGVTAWGEAASAVRYRHRESGGRMTPDYRGGVSFGKGFGHLLGAGRGWFHETTGDAVFLSRFGNDLLLYWQNRAGFTLPLGVATVQLLWNGNLTADARGQGWANVAETGPGVRFRTPGMPRSMVWSLDLMRGWYLRPGEESRPPGYTDVRAGVWYALTR